MKIENCKLKISNKAFSLIEIMVAIAIVGILSAVVLVSMSSYAKKARASKAMAQLSSALPSMISCIGNMGIGGVGTPSDGGDICTGVASYGKWPSADNYTYDPLITSITSWYIRLNSTASYDDVRICCNSAMNSCKIISPMAGAVCNASSPTK